MYLEAFKVIKLVLLNKIYLSDLGACTQVNKGVLYTYKKENIVIKYVKFKLKFQDNFFSLWRLPLLI